MEDEDLWEFRERWKRELEGRASTGGVNGGVGAVRGDRSSRRAENASHMPACMAMVEELLEGRLTSLMAKMSDTQSRRRKRHSGTANPGPGDAPPAKMFVGSSSLLLSQDEINEVPFFDVQLPYEVALNIFMFLGRTELGRCAQVSKAWKVLAEDEVLWYRLCLNEGYHRGASVSDSPCWKGTLRDCKRTKDNVQHNWKNRIGAISQLQYELGKVLCDVSSCEDLVIAGYTSGDVRLWDTLHWDAGASFLWPNRLRAEVAPRPHVSQVKINQSVAVASYTDGSVDVWSTESGQEPVHHYQQLQGVQTVALGPKAVAVATASGTQVRVDSPEDSGSWTTLCQAELHAPVESLLLVPEHLEGPLAAVAAGDSVYLLGPGRGPDVLHSIYGHPVTCLDVSAVRAALGVKSCGWAMNDGGNKIQVYSLATGQLEVSVGSSAGDFTCVNLKDSPAHLLVCGNKDRRVRLFDLRTGSSVVSLYAHHLGVTTVQADDWKIVSGGIEGLVCVWEMRTGAKLWEMHNRHPVRHLSFGVSRLVTANIPDEKLPRGACITDDDLTAHRRHRGVICLYDFSVDATQPDHVLPICRSNYTESTGYNYNIGLVVPYDDLSGPHAP
uniref:F-box and WD repeat domain containing 8 n=1 Tax=Scleropages formosus TaxID=113540 RepID=A0A8C9TST9_SCLFO